MARTRKDALDKIHSLVPGLKQHLAKIAAYPDDPARGHWKGEARAWLREMEALLRHVGKKTSAEWQARIDNWRAALQD